MLRAQLVRKDKKLKLKGTTLKENADLKSQFPMTDEMLIFMTKPKIG